MGSSVAVPRPDRASASAAIRLLLFFRFGACRHHTGPRMPAIVDRQANAAIGVDAELARGEATQANSLVTRCALLPAALGRSRRCPGAGRGTSGRRGSWGWP